MKIQDIFLLVLFAIALIFVGCNDDEDDMPPTPALSTCPLVCLNGGVVNVDSCRCACLPGFSGDSCQILDPICELQCQNGGGLNLDSCLCVCPPGFSGDSCEIEPTKTELLVSKNWMIEEAHVEPGLDLDGDGTPENDVLSGLEECRLDDFYDFELDGSYTFEEGASKCNANDPNIIISGNWSWNSESTVLILENSVGSNNEAEIISLTSTEMKWRITQNLLDSTYVFTYTWN